MSLRVRRTLKPFTSEPLKGILDIKLPWATCCDTPLTLQTAASVTNTFPPPEMFNKKTEIKQRISMRPEADDFDAEHHHGSVSQPALHAFISYLLLRILLRHCVHASVSNDSIGAGAAVGSVSGSPVSTRAWPSPRDA